MRAVLVADVGGTNTRVALVRGGDGRAPLSVSAIARFENDAFPSFYAVLDRYLSQHALPGLHACCIAVAGPVTSTRAQLTNRNWDFDAAAIAAALPAGLGQGPMRVHLVNDLVALGHALPDLSASQLAQLRPVETPRAANGQALVAGMGTGFNICLVKTQGTSTTVVEAELGHASLPCSVRDGLVDALGGDAARFDTNESLFSGGGLGRLHQILTDSATAFSGRDILAAHDPARPGGRVQAVDLAARLLGVFTRELVFQYLPFGGIHFAGGAARGILGSPAKDVFLQAFAASGPLAQHLAQVPVRLVTDDAAALTGAARCALAQDRQGG